MTSLQAGGQPAFVGAPWNGADTNTWGVSNYYAYNPQGSGSGDPLDLLFLAQEISNQVIMIGGKRRRHSNKKRGCTTKKRHNKKSTMKRRHKRKTYRGGELKYAL